MIEPGIVTLLTDFGEGSSYVAEIKGSILWTSPRTTIVDLFHGVAPQNVLEGAVRLESAFAFPPGSIHVAVVDPGVGGGRAVLFAKIRDRFFIAPDNGLLSWLVQEGELQELRRIENRTLFRPTVSRTFEGRDVMAPVAGALVSGVPAWELGPETTEMNRIEFSRPHRDSEELWGDVLFVDAFGNVVTDIRRKDLGHDRRIAVAKAGETICRTFVGTYSEAAPGEFVMLFGSQDRLEFAVVNGSASASHGLYPKTRVRLRLAPTES